MIHQIIMEVFIEHHAWHTSCESDNGIRQVCKQDFRTDAR